MIFSGWIQFHAIRRSGLFDAYYYLVTYPDCRRADIDPLRHYVRIGWKEGRNPSSYFDTKNYLAANTDVAKARINPLYHYIKNGKKEGRHPLPGAQTEIQAAQLPDISTGSRSRFYQLLKKVYRIIPSPIRQKLLFWAFRNFGFLFQNLPRYKTWKIFVELHSNTRARRYPVGIEKMNRPFKKWFELVTIKKSGLFDPNYYLITYPDCRRVDMDPLRHYMNFGWKEGRNPSVNFNTNDYLENNPSVKVAGINPLYYFLQFGLKDTPEFYLFSPGLKIPESYHPRVTVIVPNYNHSIYLQRRLDSIYSQTYENFDVILLDDCSSDNSPSILEKYQKRYPQKTSFYINDANSGSAFSQWSKGISLAQGELIWIAESDDYCEADFLEKLIPFFYDRTILLSYAHSIFVDEKENQLDFTFETYLSQINHEKWNNSYVETAHNEVSFALGLKNTIPNVSSVVFRKPTANFSLFTNSDWLKMKVCGDWLFYLNIIHGGRIAYCNTTHNYYRIHPASSSKKTHVQDIYYQEHEKIACAIASLYKVSEEFLRKNHQLLQDFYLTTVPDPDLEVFSRLFDLEKVINSQEKRLPNLLIGLFAFSYGGGEIFPIRLANAFKAKGMSVLMFNGSFEPEQPSVRAMLNPLIPILDYNYTIDINRVIEEFGIEIVHTHHASMEQLFSVMKPSDSPQAKYVATMHGMYEMMGDDFANNTQDILKGVDYWFYTAEKNLFPFIKRRLYPSKRFIKMDNGMKPPDTHKIDLSTLGIGPNSFILCLASRALPGKGWLETIEALDQARVASGKDIHLLLIGEGEVYDFLKNQSLPAYIHLLGYRADLVNILAASDAGLVPSYFKGESFPLVIIECFMAGKPVIASRIGEIPAMISTNEKIKGGILIDLHNEKILPEDISSAIVKMIQDKVYYQECLDAVEILKKRFDIDRVSEEYIKNYQNFLQR
jgi:glycosyltransferase involved in cell wall biosynthesis